MDNKLGLLLAEDLLFSSRITGTARGLGQEVRVCRTTADLLTRAEELGPGCVLLDVHHPGVDLPALVKALKACDPAPLLVAFGSHVEAETLRQARAAGVDLVLPRSKFVEDLPTALPTWLSGNV